jgi:hypothetical protein
MDRRDDRGKFIAGNSGGPGRPSRQTEAAYLAELKSVCPLEVWREIVSQVVDDARKGNVKAREFLARYFLTNAPSLTDLAVWEAADYDPLERKVSDCKMNKSFEI